MEEGKSPEATQTHWCRQNLHPSLQKTITVLFLVGAIALIPSFLEFRQVLILPKFYVIKKSEDFPYRLYRPLTAHKSLTERTPEREKERDPFINHHVFIVLAPHTC